MSMHSWTPPAVPQQALDLGHRPVWDPPAAITSVWRWTCACEMAVLDRNYVVYGSAATTPCPLVGRHPAPAAPETATEASR